MRKSEIFGRHPLAEFRPEGAPPRYQADDSAAVLTACLELCQGEGELVLEGRFRGGVLDSATEYQRPVRRVTRATLLPWTSLRGYSVHEGSLAVLSELLMTPGVQDRVWHAHVLDHRGSLVQNYHAFDDPGESVVIFGAAVPTHVIDELASCGAMTPFGDS